LAGVTEILKTFDATAVVTMHHVATFVLLVVPGFVSLRVYEFKRGDASRKASEVLLDLIVYSVGCDVVVLGGLQLVSHVVPSTLRWGADAIVLAIGLFALPSALAIGWLALRGSLLRAGIGIDNETDMWEEIVRRLTSDGSESGVILTLQDGRKVGGRLYDVGLLARSGRNDEVALGEVWTIDQQRGTFVEPVTGSLGMVVRRSECRALELHVLRRPANARDDEGRAP
jgi:Family of unknown function (DUF6338)